MKKIAIVHDWLTGMRGGEKVLECLCELFPQSDIFTLLHIPGSVSPLIENRTIYTSFLQKLPLIKTHYRTYLPLFPLAIESFSVDAYDMVISSSHCVAKGVITPPSTLHVCYSHTPMRYVWEHYHTYFGKNKKGFMTRTAMNIFAHYLRMWDVSSSNRVDYFTANSYNVANRIKKYYRRTAKVIHPPVDCSLFTPPDTYEEGGYYLIVSAFAPYKRIDIAIEAFRELGLPLVIIGGGQEEQLIKNMAKNNIKCLGWQPGEVLKDFYRNCKALIFPGVEDFGIVPLEVQACGKPVIAYAKGGVLETVRGIYPDSESRPEMKQKQPETPTGVFFTEQTTESLLEAVRFFEHNKNIFDPLSIRKHAEGFDSLIFKEKFKRYIETII
ncbi:MAG: glycosyltransferase [Candidatus Kuenenia stuttgartiensis]|jgi:glycosyltransferase involved in cell wall biosynthesis|uniref:Glycosyl transferase family 1 domain-containing protein n=1 Tax=Kuenenia stuttgartiensis TaxID=174633 RepID=A0A2C9CIY4_KUEST|nr:glycosyltransferase [Candidatus Kuenenia stuttgartiensis]MBZ0190084.1 glycosyltransferase [Candidatus Kuenenia stuttgartiensis]MCL4728669.1 glycosyltransferase [Candidatus Kuenenia stuttgartiensis]SOH05605.1 hypothetical protein KSMBR1_3128 [Candidatus Kuenenia stuttgartiensis]